ncbi:hypothetical protein RI129_011225 [Pyrocoelia pectoralis]|uniref:Intersectin-1 n=1 Tax=Pyrocoelia pectoralis TaxID=417401 RepID=A0AAN7VBM2_9COLE
MSAAGTPSADPWVVVSRERSRYEDQFRSLKPIDGIITGDQAKGFLLQSQLPPITLGQIWGLADTNADGKMDINEFSIACKLINLKLRGYEIPKVLPPTLIASLRMHNPPAVPPLPALSQTTPVQPLINQQPLITQSLISQQPPLIPTLNQTPILSTGIPTGIVPPMQSGLPATQSFIPPPPVTQPLVSFGAPLLPSAAVPTIPPPNAPPLIATAPVVPSPPLISGTNLPLTGNMIQQVSVPPTNVMPSVVTVPILSSGGVPSAPASIHSNTSTPRASISSIDRAASIDSPLVEWSVPHQTKLKYTQIFNTTDRTRSGYLSGVQARNVMVQTKLSQNILAQIWALSDMDSDGRLGCEEFVLAMHLCEQALQGVQPPVTLPPDLVPPSFRRGVRTNSVSSQGSGQVEQDPASTLPTTTFEDKRKENFEKGQAELDRRRKMLLDQQRKEAEERERKEREEIERREKARHEAERRRMEELEKQMREQQEQERLKEEERKRQADQREAARREMERQRQLEWEKQRSQELQQQRQREQETVLKLKAKNQSLTIELSSLNENIKELSQKICDTRVGVSNVKTTIDGMRSTRDSQMQEMSQLKNKLKEQNAKLLALSQEKVKLEAKNKLNQSNDTDQKQAFDNKEITIKNLKEKIEDLQSQIDGKMNDIENNNSQLNDLRTQFTQLLNECEKLYQTYEQKRDMVLEVKNTSKTVNYNTAWKTESDWGTESTSDWPVDNWATGSSTANESEVILAAAVKYRALYEFVARNSDEISFQPGDIINVPVEQTGEPGWLAGEIKGHTGWFPESYVEPMDGIGIGDRVSQEETEPVLEEIEPKRLEGIAEIPETGLDNSEPVQEISEPVTVEPVLTEEVVVEHCIASYPYQSVEQGDLSFNAGDIIAVIKKEGDWWTGKIDNNVGIFPCNYVQKYDPDNPPAAQTTTSTVTPVTAEPIIPASVTTPTDGSTSQFDNEVSQFTENKVDKSPDYPMSNMQAMKSTKKPEIASVIAPYQSSSPEQLSLQRGQLIMIRKKTDSGWWEGELQAKGRKRQVGWFPASYVKILNSSGRTSGRTTPVSTTRIQQEVVIDKVVALYPYTAANPDELSFLKDDIISVTAREEPSWWRGELNGVSGLFPSNYVSPLQQSIDPEDKMRLECINELIQTEKTYIDDMTVVYEVFEKPLRQSKIISNEEIRGIFVNWQEILQCNRNFLLELTNRWNSGSTIIGDVICAHLPLMTAYITFCSKQLESAALLQRLTETSVAFRNVVKQCQGNRFTRGMPLSSFLIKPMQRITRYPLLISKILEYTPTTSTDHQYLVEALHLADGFLKRLNENVRLKENEERLEWIQNNVMLNDIVINFNSDTNKLGPRKILHYGILTKVKSGKELVGFLFNDFLLLVQPSKASGATQFNFQRNSNVIYKIYKQPILVKDLNAMKISTDNVESGTDANRVLKVQDKRHTIALLTSSANECSLWLKRIEDAKAKYLKVVSLTKLRPKSSIQGGVSCGRLLVLVQKGTRFIRAGKLHTDNIYCKVSVNDQQHVTNVATDNVVNGNVIQNGVIPASLLVWNYSMQFLLKNINDEVLTIVVLEMCSFQPDEFLGRAEVKILDIYRETQNTNGPIEKKLILHQVESGEVTIKVDLQMFTNDY